jgi:DNA processing protein
MVIASRSSSPLIDLPIERSTPAELLYCLNSVEQRNAPKVLFFSGNPDLLHTHVRVAVVGARRASDAGLRRAARLVRALVERGMSVVSGLAAGIDTAAHRAAIGARGNTIAILGSPLDVAYPTRNLDLQRSIMRDHLAISQFPSGHPVLRTNFPQRNRTMALLSDATVIVEASDGSGTLSQGWEAIRLGRPLFLLRSVVDDPGLRWPAEMVQYGAYCVSELEELFEVLPFEPPLPAERLAF